MKLVSLVIPFYNEEAMCEYFFTKLYETLNAINDYQFEVVVVNDGSKDNTLELLKKAQKTYKGIRIVNLSRNFGHESAVAAGLSITKGDAIIPMDADLQDPPYLIKDLLEKFEEGYEVVNARRAARKNDSFMKKATASAFYKLIGKWSGKVKVPNNVGHFRLISRRVLDKVIELGEVTRVFRVEVPFVGFKTTYVEFNRPEREKGATHYNYKAMIDLAEDAIVSTSGIPLKIIGKSTILLMLIAFLSIVSEIVFSILYFCDIKLIFNEFNLWMWLIINIILIISSLLMFSLTLIGEYTSKTFKEVQHRPFFIIDEVIEEKGE